MGLKRRLRTDAHCYKCTRDLEQNSPPIQWTDAKMCLCLVQWSLALGAAGYFRVQTQSRNFRPNESLTSSTLKLILVHETSVLFPAPLLLAS